MKIKNKIFFLTICFILLLFFLSCNYKENNSIALNIIDNKFAFQVNNTNELNTLDVFLLKYNPSKDDFIVVDFQSGYNNYDNITITKKVTYIFIKDNELKSDDYFETNTLYKYYINCSQFSARGFFTVVEGNDEEYKKNIINRKNINNSDLYILNNCIYFRRRS